MLPKALSKGWLPQLVLLLDESFEEANFFKNKTYVQQYIYRLKYVQFIYLIIIL